MPWRHHDVWGPLPPPLWKGWRQGTSDIMMMRMMLDVRPPWPYHQHHHHHNQPPHPPGLLSVFRAALVAGPLSPGGCPCRACPPCVRARWSRPYVRAVGPRSWTDTTCLPWTNSGMSTASSVLTANCRWTQNSPASLRTDTSTAKKIITGKNGTTMGWKIYERIPVYWKQRVSLMTTLGFSYVRQ